jgi:hypothetical protein
MPGFARQFSARIGSNCSRPCITRRGSPVQRTSDSDRSTMGTLSATAVNSNAAAGLRPNPCPSEVTFRPTKEGFNHPSITARLLQAPPQTAHRHSFGLAMADRGRPRTRAAFTDHRRCLPGRPMNVLLLRWDTKARQAHQGDVPTSCIDTQNVFLCRGSRELIRLDHAAVRGRSCLSLDVACGVARRRYKRSRQHCLAWNSSNRSAIRALRRSPAP